MQPVCHLLPVPQAPYSTKECGRTLAQQRRENQAKDSLPGVHLVSLQQKHDTHVLQHHGTGMALMLGKQEVPPTKHPGKQCPSPGVHVGCADELGW